MEFAAERNKISSFVGIRKTITGFKIKDRGRLCQERTIIRQSTSGVIECDGKNLYPDWK